MRKVNRGNWEEKPAIFATPEYRTALANLVANPTIEIDVKYYKNAINVEEEKIGEYKTVSLVLENLHKYYHYKCAYCERVGQHDIEHYRPKRKVSEDLSHTGYYWLAYEWSNLIPSCVKCNRDGGKHNKFDILGTRVTTPSLSADNELILANCLANSSMLLAEIPKLLHPELDDAIDYFSLKKIE